MQTKYKQFAFVKLISIYRDEASLVHDELAEHAVESNELVVRALLDESSLLHDEDLVDES